MSTEATELERPSSRVESSPDSEAIDKLARRIVREPLCDEKWLRRLYAEFVLRRTVPQPGDIYSRELPLLVETRGGQKITFDQQVFTGVMPGGTVVQLLTDESGYHKLVRQAGRQGYQEPQVTGGSNSDEVISAQFLETRYQFTGLDITVEDDTIQCRAIRSDGSTVPVYPLEDVLGVIDANTVVPFRQHDTGSAEGGEERPSEPQSARGVGATAVRAARG